MPQVNFTIPDSSPIITYSPLGAWGDSDLVTQLYTNRTFHFTNHADASLDFSFVGTGVSLHGARRLNHDQYTVSVDGKPTLTASSHTDNTIGEFNITLFETTQLPFGKHTITLTNTPRNGTAYVDLDWVNIIIGDDHTNTSNNDIWLDNTSTNFTWDGSWHDGTNEFSSQYYDSTFTMSNIRGGVATLVFYGNAVSLYGATSPGHGSYSVSLDDTTAEFYNASQIVFRPQQLLYLASGLKLARHTVTIVKQDDMNMDMDFAIVSHYDSEEAVIPVSAAGTVQETSVTALDTIQPNHTSTTLSSPNSAAGSHAHAMIGGIAGGVLLILLVAAAYCLRRFRQKRAEKGKVPQATKDEVLDPPNSHQPRLPDPQFMPSTFVRGHSRPTTVTSNVFTGSSSLASPLPRKARQARIAQLEGQLYASQVGMRGWYNASAGNVHSDQQQTLQDQTSTLQAEVNRLRLALAATHPAPPAYEAQ